MITLVQIKTKKKRFFTNRKSMRKANQEITDPKVKEGILAQSNICRIAMNDAEAPYILPFNYGYRDNCLYIHSAAEGKKIDLIKNNSKVCFEIEDEAEIVKHEKACNWATTYKSIVGYGKMSIINDYDEKCQALEIIMKQHGSTAHNHFEEKQVNAVVILKLTITHVTGKQSGNLSRKTEKKKHCLDSERLHLVEIGREDIDNIHQLHSFPEVDEFNTLGIPESIEDTIKIVTPLIEAQKETPQKTFTWKILRKDTGEFAGLAGMTLSRDKFRLGELYYKLMPSQWGQGFATEVARALIQCGFEEFNLHKVEAGVATENHRSIRVLEKAGMTREGLRRKILPIRDEWKDNYHYAIVEGENT